MFVYIDESIHTRGGFIIVGVVFSKFDQNKFILQSLTKHGFKSDDEFKSGMNYSKFPKMALVRKDLKRIIFSYSNIGIIVLPSKNKEQLGKESLRGLKEFLIANNITEEIEVYIDQNFFKNNVSAKSIAEKNGFTNCHFNFEQDSKRIRGIQLADLVAHTCSIMLLETLGLSHKNVKVGENSGYDPEMEVNLGFELWASIRYQILHKSKIITKESDDIPVFDVIPNGLYISEYCDLDLSKAVKERFGTLYLGCIH